MKCECGRRCVDHVVYVIGERQNPPSVKVGYSKRPGQRLSHLRQQTGRDLALLSRFRVACKFTAMDVETEAHRWLGQLWTGRGEWFHADKAIAECAVTLAARAVAKGGDWE